MIFFNTLDALGNFMIVLGTEWARKFIYSIGGGLLFQLMKNFPKLNFLLHYINYNRNLPMEIENK